MNHRGVVALALTLGVLGMLGCGGGASSSGSSGGDASSTAGGATRQAAEEVEALVPRVVAEYPHDTRSFTQGLLAHEGSLYESAGQYGQSSLREVDTETGAVVRQVAVGPSFFAEGLAVVDDRLIQLTWQEETAFVYDLDTFEQVDSFAYDGEGWGLCQTGDALFMSDGSSTLTERDPSTFEARATIDVTNLGEPVERLNELECIGDRIYANVWQTDTIVQIDPLSGDVVAEIDASGLLDADERAALSSQAVLNGIADAGGGRLYLTGKYWPRLFEVELVPA